MAASDDDWRLRGQERYLLGSVLHRASYTARRAGWDHDHCEFCLTKFMEAGHPETLHEGFTTDDQYRWICPSCFEDFKERFRFSVRDKGS